MGISGIWAIASIFTIALICLSLIQQSEARQNREDIGFVLSQTCITMITNNIETNCPTYEELNMLFPDTSNAAVSGGFIEDSNDFWHRENKHLNDHIQFYQFGQKGIWIDPPGDIRSKIKIITIENTLNDYLTFDSYKMFNNTINLATERYIDEKCMSATINGANWLYLAGDTMQLMAHECDASFTNFDEKKTIQLEASYQDITTSYKYQLEKWITESKLKCQTICKEY